MKFALVILLFFFLLPLTGFSQGGGYVSHALSVLPSTTVQTTASGTILTPIMLRKVNDFFASGSFSQVVLPNPQLGDFVIVTGTFGTMRSIVTLSKEQPASFRVRTENNLTYAITVSPQAVVTSANGQKQVVQLRDLPSALPMHSSSYSNAPATGEFQFAIGAQIPGDFQQLLTNGQLNGVFNVTICSN